jgi:hypothetical protein
VTITAGDNEHFALLLRFMPAGKAVPAFDRTWLALALTCQAFVGAFLGIAAQFVLAIGVIFYVLPSMALELWTPLALSRSSICR